MSLPRELDPKGRDEILAAIHKLHEERGITVILVSHSMEDVARLVDRIIVMHKGKVAMTGTPREIFLIPWSWSRWGWRHRRLAMFLQS